MATYWVPDLPDIKRFAGCFWCSILIFANGASSVWSSRHINMLGRVCGLVKCFLSLKLPKIMKSGWGDWKRVSCHGNQIFYSRRCVTRRVFERSLLQIKRDSSIYILDVILDWVNDDISKLDLQNKCRQFQIVNCVYNLSWNSMC